ncbi:MAG TPA: amidase domain-containing protein [Cerasibacillus sp.]|uniref:amidase domain-containing protein n=1 Tax=Cerasibacillus sp. TaxID=2498711 RepID=UPI002F3F882B
MDIWEDYWKNVLSFQFNRQKEIPNWLIRKKELYKQREATIIKINGKAHIYHRLTDAYHVSFQYLLHLVFLIKQHELIYAEEVVIPYRYYKKIGGTTIHEPLNDRKRNHVEKEPSLDLINNIGEHQNMKRVFKYDRLKAVQYAERWWNSYHPNFRQFDVDCTNYVSQCLYAGGALMWGSPVRNRGWWYRQDNWSYSWAVAHSMRWYLSGASQGIKGIEKSSPEQLLPGDVICYDFQGDGRWDHTTIVVTKDANNMPLVNAHTVNSRHRYWSYEDSTAWTPQIEYKFFHLTES